jgi:hypothetical protein
LLFVITVIMESMERYSRIVGAPASCYVCRRFGGLIAEFDTFYSIQYCGTAYEAGTVMSNSSGHTSRFALPKPCDVA